MEKTREEAKQFRETVLEAVSQAGSMLGQGAQALLTDWHKLSRTVRTLVVNEFKGPISFG